MTRRNAARPSGDRTPSPTLDPYFAALILAGVGLGTWSLPACARLALLWTTMLLLWLAFREGHPLQLAFRFADLGRGISTGLALGIPLVLIAHRPLSVAVPILYIGATVSSTVWTTAHPSVAGAAEIAGTLAFVNLVLLAPLAESLFFHDLLHRERGYLVGTGLYAAAGVILFLPPVGAFWAVLLIICAVTAVLGILYGLMYERYGLVTAWSAHTAINLCLLFIPALINLFSGS